MARAGRAVNTSAVRCVSVGHPRNLDGRWREIGVGSGRPASRWRSPTTCASLQEWRRRSGRGGFADAGRPLNDGVDEAVVLGLLGGEPAVAVGIGLDPLDRLTGV